MDLADSSFWIYQYDLLGEGPGFMKVQGVSYVTNTVAVNRFGRRQPAATKGRADFLIFAPVQRVRD